MLPLNRAVAERARALVGTRFRPQGRRQEDGLDCVGLVASAARLPEELVPIDYTLRSQASEDLLALTFGGRVQRIQAADADEGDVLLVRAGAGQHHFLVLTGDGFIHSDVQSGRVVERPGSVEWPIIAAWRIREQD